jgi:protein gp37
MSTAASKIEWTDATWNPVRGCALVSPGCTNCYAMKQAHRFSGKGQPYAGLTKLRPKGGPVWTGRARFIPEQLAEPLRWRAPRKVFVNSMSDLFHEDVTNEQIAAVFGVMAACPQHTFQVLTKRAERMLDWFEWLNQEAANLPNVVGATPPLGASVQASACVMMAGISELGTQRFLRACETRAWPLPNVWLGVSVEDQKRATDRIPSLLRTPAAVRFVSAEPLLEGVDLSYYLEAQGYESNGPAGWVATGRGIDWVIVGGESGPGARPFCLSWAMNIVADCEEASVPVFVKQLGARPYVVSDAVELRLNDRKGGDWNEWEPYLRVRQFPEVQT